MAQNEASIWQPSVTTVIQGNTKAVTETIIATASQTVFPITAFTYALDTGALEVHQNGLLLTQDVDWTEATTTSFILTVPATVSDVIIAKGTVASEVLTGPVGPTGDRGAPGDKGDKGDKGLDGTDAVFDAPIVLTMLDTFADNNGLLRFRHTAGTKIVFRVVNTLPQQPNVVVTVRWSGSTAGTTKGGLTLITFGNNMDVDVDPAVSELITGAPTALVRVNTLGTITWTFTFDYTITQEHNALITIHSADSTYSGMEMQTPLS